MAYAKAFKCQECPEKSGPEGCPCWWEMIETQGGSGEQRLKKGCGLSQEMLLCALIEVIKASNRPAAAVESCRNEIAQGFQVMAQGMKEVGFILMQGKESQFLPGKPQSKLSPGHTDGD